MAGKEGDVPKIEEADEAKENKKKPQKVKEVSLHKNMPFWMSKSEYVTNVQYVSFCKSNGWEGHLAVKHCGAEGQQKIHASLSVPRRAPFDLFGSMKKRSIIILCI